MKLEVLLSLMNLNKKNLDKMNINTHCTVINQCGKDGYEKYKNFDVYSYNEKGVSNSRNKGLTKVIKDVIIFCDDDVIYNKNFEKLVLEEFKKNKKADVILFNFNVLNRKKRKIKKRKKLHLYNSLNYATYNIAFKKDKITNNKITFNTMFGPGAKYSNGSDTLFIVDLFKKKLNVYSSPLFLGTVSNDKSTWFDGYNEKYFFNKGALFTAISKKFRHILMIQHIIRHKYILTDYNIFDAYKIMKKGSKEYINDISNNKCI